MAGRLGGPRGWRCRLRGAFPGSLTERIHFHPDPTASPSPPDAPAPPPAAAWLLSEVAPAGERGEPLLLQSSRVSGLLVLGAVLAAPLSAQTLDPPAPPDLGRFFPSDGSPEDGRRTLAAFPKNLGRGLVGVFSKDSLAPLLIGAAASGGSSFFDTRTRRALSSPATIIGNAGDTGGSLPVMAPIALGLFASGRFVGDGRFRAA